MRAIVPDTTTAAGVEFPVSIESSIAYNNVRTVPKPHLPGGTLTFVEDAKMGGTRAKRQRTRTHASLMLLLGVQLRLRAKRRPPWPLRKAKTIRTRCSTRQSRR